MYLPIFPEPNDTVREILSGILKKKVRLWSEGGQLRYQAPKGALAPEDLLALRQHRGDIVALLAQVSDVGEDEIPLRPREHSNTIPVTSSQLMHWSQYKLTVQPAIRQVAAAVHLAGKLNLNALEHATTEVIRRHEALRTQIAEYDGILSQVVCAPSNFHLNVEDLIREPASTRRRNIINRIQSIIMEPVNPASDPLFSLQILKVNEYQHVLVVAMEHMISDGASLHIIMQELFSAYVSAFRHMPFQLPEVPIQLGDYAVWQNKNKRMWLQKHVPYWSQRLAGARKVNFPVDQSSLAGSGWSSVSVWIDRNLKDNLLKFSRQQKTTLVMSMFTAYAALVLRWCATSNAVFKFQIDGRFNAVLQNTVGYLSSALYLRLELTKHDTYMDLSKKVTDEFCSAYLRADSSHLATETELAATTLFNWIPGSSDDYASTIDLPENPLVCTPFNFEHPMLKNMQITHEPTIVLKEADKGVVADIEFPLSRHTPESMNAFARAFLRSVAALVTSPTQLIEETPLLQPHPVTGLSV